MRSKDRSDADKNLRDDRYYTSAPLHPRLLQAIARDGAGPIECHDPQTEGQKYTGEKVCPHKDGSQIDRIPGKHRTTVTSLQTSTMFIYLRYWWLRRIRFNERPRLTGKLCVPANRLGLRRWARYGDALDWSAAFFTSLRSLRVGARACRPNGSPVATDYLRTDSPWSSSWMIAK